MAKSRKKIYPLSIDGINRLIDDLEAYKKRLLVKAEQLLKELSKRGIKTAKERIQGVTGDSDKNVKVEVTDISYVGNSVVFTISASGEDILFIEFGAGIYYNGGKGMVDHSPHPKGEEMGCVIGGYPKGRKGRSLGRFDSWTTPEGKISFGTKAAMPMLGASETIYASVDDACRKVFGK